MNSQDINNILVAGMTSKSCDFTDQDTCTITYTVSDDVAAGDKIDFYLVVNNFMVSSNDKGDQAVDYSNALTGSLSLKEPVLSVTVQ